MEDETHAVDHQRNVWAEFVVAILAGKLREDAEAEWIGEDGGGFVPLDIF